MIHKKIIYNILSYTIIGIFLAFIAVASVATICGDGNKGFFELFK